MSDPQTDPEAPVYLRQVDEVYGGRTLVRLLLRKVARRLQGGRSEKLGPIVIYNGLTVFDQPELHGGGLWYNGDYARLFVELGVKPSQRMFEFCAGPGYIGYYLLSLGYCDQLVLADINPAAVAAAQRTADFNGLTDRVKVYLSEGLSAIPAHEKWDLVVGNPPHFLNGSARSALRSVDPEWMIHADFYRNVGKFMNSGGRVVLVENGAGSTPAIFEPMIAAGGGRVEAVLPARNALGRDTGSYFVVSRW